MNVRSICLAAASVASLFATGSAYASPNSYMPGQSARAGTQSQADLRAEYRGRPPAIIQNRYSISPASGWMQDDYLIERAYRPDRQR